MTDRLVAGMRCSEAADLAAGFVLGALDRDEMDRVRAHLAECREAHAEFEELGSVVPALLASVPQVEPPAALGSRVLAAARAERAAAQAARSAEPAVPETRATEQPAADRRDGFGFLRLGRPVWAAAGVVAVLAIAVLGAQVVRLQAQIDAERAYQQGVAAVVEAASAPGGQLAVLSAGNGTSGPSGIAAVASDGTVKLAMRGLAPTSGSQVYEAWLIAGTAAPQPIGGFRVDSSGAAAFSTGGTSTAGVVVALTLEPNTGATTPTLPIVAKGAAQGPAG